MKAVFPFHNADHTGFTLMEVLVAVAVMGIAFTGILKLYAQSVTLNSHTRFHARAPLVARQVLGEWQLSGHPLAQWENRDLETPPEYEIQLKKIPFVGTKAGKTLSMAEIQCRVRLRGSSLSHTATLLVREAP